MSELPRAERTDPSLFRGHRITEPPPNRSATGYGRKIASAHEIKYGDARDVWRRVYVVCFSNSGTRYILINKLPVYLDHLTEQRIGMPTVPVVHVDVVAPGKALLTGPTFSGHLHHEGEGGSWYLEDVDTETRVEMNPGSATGERLYALAGRILAWHHGVSPLTVAVDVEYERANA